MTKFDQLYQNLLKDIMTKGVEDVSKRQGIKTKALPGLTFQTDIEKDGFPLLTSEKFL